MKNKYPNTILLIILLGITGFPIIAQNQFSFFAIGDMPYHNPADIEKFKKLTTAINDEKPAFTVHVGDIKNGQSECSDIYFNMILDMFNQFQAPLIYTPGDNEWTDCGRPGAGGHDPVERLNTLRKLYFRNGESLGKMPLKFISQNINPGFDQFVENVKWQKNGITFGTVHVVGSNNNFKADVNANQEHLKRDQANIHWISEVFKTAQADNDAAIVIIMHAALNYVKSETNGFTSIVEKLRSEVKAFKKPVLLIYGDHHRFQISKPLMDSENILIQNFTALMVYGDTEMNAVKINVDTKSKSIFSFTEYIMEY
ncbi:MAG: metallophosphoesterase [Cyclobacteriaceae bacterium]